MILWLWSSYFIVSHKDTAYLVLISFGLSGFLVGEFLYSMFIVFAGVGVGVGLILAMLLNSMARNPLISNTWMSFLV